VARKRMSLPPPMHDANKIAMNFARPVVFWIAMLVAFVAVIILLRGVLLPFVAALVLAYLLNPLANKIDQLGVGRLSATLAIVIPVVITIVVLLVLTVPIIIRELAHFRQGMQPPDVERQAFDAAIIAFQWKSR
jgi:predicted PurR-regulated permease PerM